MQIHWVLDATALIKSVQNTIKIAFYPCSSSKTKQARNIVWIYFFTASSHCLIFLYKNEFIAVSVFTRHYFLRQLQHVSRATSLPLDFFHGCDDTVSTHCRRDIARAVSPLTNELSACVPQEMYKEAWDAEVCRGGLGHGVSCLVILACLSLSPFNLPPSISCGHNPRTPQRNHACSCFDNFLSSANSRFLRFIFLLSTMTPTCTALALKKGSARTETGTILVGSLLFPPSRSQDYNRVQWEQTTARSAL